MRLVIPSRHHMTLRIANSRLTMVAAPVGGSMTLTVDSTSGATPPALLLIGGGYLRLIGGGLILRLGD